MRDKAIVRKIDEEGRIAIPPSIRKLMSIKNNDPVKFIDYGHKNVPLLSCFLPAIATRLTTYR